jgi:hypothetical protein
MDQRRPEAQGGWVSAAAFRPQARHEGLVIRDVADEVLVYDLDQHRAHALNRPALLVWRECDGRRSVQELTSRLQPELPGANEEVVWLALAELDRAQLLQERLPMQRAVSRRQVLARLGLSVAAGTLILPAVTSVVAPHPAAAQTTAACAGRTCTNFETCGPGGTCVCATTSEGLGFCVDGATPCAGLTACTSSAGCPSGQACVVNTCCGAAGVCVGPCPGGAGSAVPAPGVPTVGSQ